MAVNLSPVGGVAAQFFTNSGVILSGGKIYTYAAGTTTNQTTYTSSNGGTAHTNPIILDSAGRVPGGEIWLTDGLQYKFVLKDANDVLIGTYDNIIGINSNFVNFTNEQEIQTATAGQTVFTLTTMQYQPATGSLSVFVDGVNQYGPGAQYAYIETSSTVVTFISGLHVGASVKFTTSSINASSYGTAADISYTPAGAGAVITNVQAKLRESVSIEDFGGAAGASDNTAAMNAAADYLNSIGGGVILIPYVGNWLMNWVCLYNNITVQGVGGDGEYSTTVIRPYTISSAAITFGDGTTIVRYCGLQYVHISGSDGTVSGQTLVANNAPHALRLRGGVVNFTADRVVLYNGVKSLSLEPSATQPVTGVRFNNGTIRNDITNSANARCIYMVRLADPGYCTDNKITQTKVNGPTIGYAAEIDGTAAGIAFEVSNSYWDIKPGYGVLLKGASQIIGFNTQLDPGALGAIVIEADNNGDIARFVVGYFRNGGQQFKTPAYTWTLPTEADTFNYRARINTAFLSPITYLSQVEDPYNTTVAIERTTSGASAPVRLAGADFHVAKELYVYGGNGTAACILTASTASGGAYLAAFGTNQDIRLVPTGTGLVRSTRPIRIDSTTVAALTSAVTVATGARAFVSDALSPVWGNAVTGGGAVPVPVYSDGTIWRVG